MFVKAKKSSKGNADKRDVTAFEHRLWPDGILPYKLQRRTIGNFNICLLNLTSVSLSSVDNCFIFLGMTIHAKYFKNMPNNTKQ